MELISKYWAHICLVISAGWIVYKYFVEKEDKKNEKKKEEYRNLIDVIVRYKMLLIEVNQSYISRMTQSLLYLRKQREEHEKLNKIYDEQIVVLEKCKSGDKKCMTCTDLFDSSKRQKELCDELKDDDSDFEIIDILQEFKHKISPYTLISNQVSGLDLFASDKVRKTIVEIDVKTNALITRIDLFSLGKCEEDDIHNLINEILIKCDTVIGLIKKEI